MGWTTESIVEQLGALRSDYDAARRTRFKRTRQGVSATGSNADYHYRTWHAYAAIMETARDLYRNHPLIGQGIRRLSANILRGGFNLDVKTGDDSLDQDLKGRWDEWANDPDACDRQGENDFHGLEKFVFQHTIVDGDIISLPLRDGQLQLVEAHRLRTPSRTKKNVVHGILLDESRRRREYWITKEEIEPRALVKLVGDMNQFPARQPDELTGRQERAVLHHYMGDRVSQTRGLTALVPVVDTAGMGDDLMFAQLVKAQMTACVTLFRELSDSVTTPPNVGGDTGLATETEARPDGTTRTLADWQPGLEVFGYPGEKLQGFSPNVPNAEFFQHASLILSIVAVNLDLPLAVLMLDPTNTNFSGWRGAMDQARQRFQEIQRWMVSSFHDRVYRWKVRQWAGKDPAIRSAVEAWVQRGRNAVDSDTAVNPFGHKWHAQGWPYIEPVNDVTADVIEERNHMSSPRRIYARRGLDYGDVMTESMDDRDMAIRLAIAKAKAVNESLKPDPPVSWRDYYSPGMPEGVSLKRSAEPKPSQNPTTEPTGQPVNRLKVNGHAN